MNVDGVIVVDKPGGMTSHDVVDEVRRRFKTKKVGHAGTLDPDATGVLLVGLGKATRFLSYAQQGPKRYTAVAAFGETTTTQDASGDVLARCDVEIGEDDVRRALGGFTGEIDQVPPMVSAVKIGGERLYRKARRGEEVERAARRVTIFDLELRSFERVDGRAEAALDVRCSAGTYVRTLVHDLGAALGCGAHLKTLRRTEAGGFTEADARPLDAVTETDVRPLADAVRELQRLAVDRETATLVEHGRPLPLLPVGVEDGHGVAIVAGHRLLAVYVRRDDRLVADRVVAT